MAKPEKHVFVCVQNRPPGHPRGSCASRNGVQVLQTFQQQFEQRQLWTRFAITSCGCLGPCDQGANVLVYPDGVLYGAVGADDVKAIIDGHLLADRKVDKLAVPAPAWG